MKRSLVIPADTRDKQAIASDPRNSAWVSANAGSGKTHVLSQRVIRLLLDGTDPSKILCLTYTKAAAANMAARVFDTLARWTTLSDADLDAALDEVDRSRSGKGRRELARRLFARALETPGGLKIQTIHAFCEAILHQFPLEANVAGHFELLDAQKEAALVAEARRDLLSGVSSGEAGELSEAFADVLETGGESGLEALLAEIVAKRDALRQFIDRVGHAPEPYAELFEEFGFSPSDTVENLAETVWPLPGLSRGEFNALVAEAHATDARTVLNGIVPHVAAAFEATDPVRALELLAKGLLKADGDPYGPKTFKAALQQRLPDLVDRYGEAARHLLAVKDRVALLGMLRATRSALRLADWLIGRYERLKRVRGFLDFNDLIVRTSGLLARQDAGAWVHYKLDRGIDHILIDEAQDTSPQQWAVVKALAAEFFSGLGARDGIARTIFAVGDEKQSIYSFQGAEPAAFSESGLEFRSKVEPVGRFASVELKHSFRSTEDILGAVDLVFADEQRRAGLTYYKQDIQHAAIRAGAPGYVELWPPIAPEKEDEPDDWTQAIDHASAPAVLLADRIADTIAGWIADGEVNEATGKRVRPGDIIVLVRRRDRFVHALVRALKDNRRGIPVAGADRLKLASHIAVKDLVALGRFALQPEDDLSLAALLKSPVFDLDEDALYALAQGRSPGISLWSSLTAHAEGNPRLERIADILRHYADRAAFSTVFDFYATILSGTPDVPGARAKLIGRLGHEAGDVLDEFLAYCLASEKTGTAGLEAFLAGFETSAPEIKREMDQSRDEVRVMTVHAAKGLEAPIVFLVDGGSAAHHDQHQPRLMRIRLNKARIDGYLWRASKDLASTVTKALGEEIKTKAEAEYRRLLYVGMTRAEDRLIVCGYHGSRRPTDPSWHRMVSEAFESSPDCETVTVGDAEVLRYRVTPRKPVAVDEEGREASPAAPLPDFLRRPPPPAPVMPRPLAPSGASAVIEAHREPVVSPLSPVLDHADQPAFAAERGTAIHWLLQILPDMDPHEREAAARRYLARIGAAWGQGEIEAAWSSVDAILRDDRFRDVFAPGSRAEVSIMGTVTLGTRPFAVSGKIDRLAVTADAALIVDYKTNRPAPAMIDEVPPGYVAQLGLYRALLSPIYSGRRIEAALLFTDAPRLVPLPAAMLDAALARLTRA